MEKFLAFWSHHNATIIETLVALILLSALYLAYRTFFGNKGGVDTFDTSGAGAGANTAHIEKTLQKILDQQSTLKASGASAGGDGAPTELLQELGTLKAALEEKEKQIVVLQEKAAQAATAAKAGTGGPSAEAIAAAASAAAGLAEKERADYEARIKELEARLAEYEIISEDIADLSFFKEENARLTKELEEARAGGGGGAPSSAPAAPAAPAAAPASEPAPAAAAAPAPNIPEPSAEAANAIDDSLMAEFAKAVEGQKSGTLEEAPKTDDSKLLEEFENFNKKS
ncbi:hypothetical protein [Bdellovibrio sp. HCB337]|uniref:hypothetical protein n=1 Tax=Bdellovibrio sp. HCB337 TaxID=3394358 RepID=UPI0039A6B05B